MDLSDYAYNEGDRWYIDPRVSLDEQNAFINNLRNLQAQDNAQIEQQTRGLGTQVPSQLGGLIGAGSYFRARQQTPQTNQTVAALRSAMRAQAIQTALQNELEKEKKKYKDAQNNATISSTNNDTWSPDDKGGNGDKEGTEYVGTDETRIENSIDTLARKFSEEVIGDKWYGGYLGALAGQALGSYAFGPLNPLSLPMALYGYKVGSHW